MKPPLREVGLVGQESPPRTPPLQEGLKKKASPERGRFGGAGKPSPHPSLAGGAKEESLPCEGEGLENKIIRDKKAK